MDMQERTVETLQAGEKNRRKLRSVADKVRRGVVYTGVGLGAWVALAGAVQIVVAVVAGLT
jgi:hypothetical protein